MIWYGYIYPDQFPGSQKQVHSHPYSYQASSVMELQWSLFMTQSSYQSNVFSLFTEQLIVRFCLVSNYLELWFSKKFELNTYLDKTWLVFPTRIEVEPWLHGILLCISPKCTCKSIDSDVWGETWAPGRVLSKTIHWRMMTWQVQRLSQFGLDQFLEPCWQVCCRLKRSRLFGNGIRLGWEGKI